MSRWPISSGLYRAPALASLPVVEHAFGTRHTAPPGSPRVLKQIHSARVLEAAASCDTTEGDALLTAEAGLWIAVKTADCVPILLADTGGRAVAAVHAGWRGTRAGVARKAVEHLCERFGLRPRDLIAAIGPSIGPCCYEVGEEVAREFATEFVRQFRRPHLDLWSANGAALREAGLPAGQVDVAGLCTCCQTEQFHSWRRDGAGAGRMHSAIRIVPR